MSIDQVVCRGIGPAASIGGIVTAGFTSADVAEVAETLGMVGSIVNNIASSSISQTVS